MSERTQAHQTHPEPGTGPVSQTAPVPPAVKSRKPGRKTVTMVVLGTTTVAIAAALLFQVFSAESGVAGIDGNPANAAETDRSKQYLARINGELITWQEVANEAMLRYGSEVLDQIVNRKIVQQACKARGIEVTEAEVTSEITRIAQKFKMPVDTWYQLLQTERNLTPVQYRRDIIWPMLALKRLAGERIAVTQEDLQKAFTRDYGPKVQAKVIMLDNHRRALEVHEKLRRDPAQFEELARTYSVEPNSRALDGSIPPIHRYYSNPKLEKVAFSLKENEISGIIQVGVDRYVIMKSEGQTEPIVTDLAQVKDDLMERLHEERLQEAVAKVFDKLRRDAKVDNYLKNQTSGVQQVSGSTAQGGVESAAGSYPAPATTTTP